MALISGAKLVLATGLVCMSGGALAAHPFHETLAEVQFNAATRSFEVALRVYPEEMEAVISRVQRQRFRLDAPDATQRMQRYIERSFVIGWPGQPGRFRWEGWEREAACLWCYFQWQAPPDVAGNARLEDRLLFELYDDQTNLVLWRGGTPPQSVPLSPQQWKLALPMADIPLPR